MYRNKKGFTLIEMLLTTAVLLALAGTVATAFFQGQKFFRHLNESRTYKDLAIFLEKITRDLKNSTPNASIPFVRSRQQISFPTLLTQDGTAEIGDEGIPATAVYYYDANSKRVIREVRKRAAPDKPERQVVMNGVETLSFEVLPEEASKFPTRVKMRMRYGSDPSFYEITKLWNLAESFNQKLKKEENP
jgi:prepilin-type N-terminal cleavage/methylation domain-containing protein